MEGSVSNMQNVVTSLSSTVSGEALWGTFATAIPYIATITLFAFGFYIIRRLIKKIAKGKAGV